MMGPLLVKLSPSVTDIVAIARAAAGAGATALTVANTHSGMAVDWERRRPVLGGVTGGLSGPAVKPLILRLVWLVSRAVPVPVVASGGASCARDVLEYMVAGATAVQVGTAAFVEPGATGRILDDLAATLSSRGIDRVSSLVGSLEVREPGDA
jgi:dihydroorotate dehydrogenase (NAD+) catalytic subunit